MAWGWDAMGADRVCTFHILVNIILSSLIIFEQPVILLAVNKELDLIA